MSNAAADPRPKWYHGIGGLGPNLSVFTAPPWVDLSKPPGHTSQSLSMKDSPEWRFLLSGAFILYSINLLWLLIAIVGYVAFPYDFDVATRWDVEYGRWIAKRAVLNLTLVHAYYGFWHGSLYGLGWAERPFNSRRGKYRWDKLVHNAYYTSLGTIQWTVWEAIMVHCYATGRMPYLSDEEAWSTWLGGVGQFAFWSIAVPLYREVHFYFVHRLIHLRSLYAYVHAVHHRNTDIEPYSGLCMHPIEHLYYFTSIAPSLYFRITPFAFLWNGIHLILSPGASHSGWEGHVDSDQYHYLHHRYFECNYGTPSFLLDSIFGTFRDKLSSKSDTYRGNADNAGENAAGTLDRKATLLGWPDLDQLVFDVLFCIAIPSMFGMALIQPSSSLSGRSSALAALVVFGPIVGSILLEAMKSLSKATRRGKKEPSFWRQLSYPFHKEATGCFGMHLIVGFAMGVLPAFHLCHMALSQPGNGSYFALRGYG